ncbi:hypothetical protein CCR75_004870 [Bremia lactucae]|uniref:Uncharacterized protein n=1 Tax=Bremia lactucae TaxID=4779 RepID=A0A976III0_BRELC|nr:hypothetical protein CCR75_008481 [Bremia lactucae]TDH72520.1 hypothetical protein CCR75_004870 [Bremia lactucae]
MVAGLMATTACVPADIGGTRLMHMTALTLQGMGASVHATGTTDVANVCVPALTLTVSIES